MAESLRVAFRVDASTEIGSGHVMRCLALADALAQSGARCHFIMRQQPGNMEQLVRGRGHDVTMLPESALLGGSSVTEGAHAAWLGTDWATDACGTLDVLSGDTADWLVVDHYALDRRWEERVSGCARRLMVVDDLADRPHVCDLLLDQNLGRRENDYSGLLPAYAKPLIGPRYALLRPEFAQTRAGSLAGRENSAIESILISMGGVDRDNVTGEVLKVLEGIPELHNCRVTAVLGAACPHIDAISRLADRLSMSVEIGVNVNNMAEIMAGADVAIGAAGGSAWERCCLGLPTLLVVMADNQRNGARALQESGATLSIGGFDDIRENLPILMHRIMQPGRLRKMSRQAADLCDGLGVERVVKTLIGGGH